MTNKLVVTADKPLVTVVIPNWNGKKYFRTCLDSLKKLEARSWKLEIIVVDNGSTDGSLEFLKKNYPKVQIFTFSENRGFSAAVNLGIKGAQGRYIALLNNDTEVDKNWLQNLVIEAEKSDAKTMSFASKMVNFYQRDLLDSCGDGYTWYGRAYKRGLKQKDKGQFDKKEFIFGACAGAALYKKELFEKIGSFDEDFFAFNEDVDLSFRAQLAGFKCLYVPQAIVHHIKGGFSDNSTAFFLGVKNTLNVVVKNWPAKFILLNLPKIIYAQARIFFASLKLGFYTAFSKGYLCFLLQLPTMLRKRKQVQRLRVVSDEYLRSIIEDRYPF